MQELTDDLNDRWKICINLVENGVMEAVFGNTEKSLGTRILAKNFRTQIEKKLVNNGFVIFNFQDVNLISHSFADECYGKLLLTINLEQLKAQTSFINTKPEIKKMISFVLKERLLKVEYN